MLIVRTSQPVDTDSILRIIRKYTHFVSLRTANITSLQCELIFAYRSKSKDMNMAMIQEIQSIDGIASVNGLLDNSNIIG